MTSPRSVYRHSGPCAVDGCTRPRTDREWCHTHYEYWRRHGEIFVPPTPADRFWKFVDKSGNCWEWTGSKLPRGYGTFSVGGRKGPAHRFSYRLHKGEIPDGYEVDHLCFNTSCVNPEHLEAVTPKVNSRRSADRVTHCPQGHPYAGDNLAVIAGARRCKACAYPRVREWKRRQRKAA